MWHDKGKGSKSLGQGHEIMRQFTSTFVTYEDQQTKKNASHLRKVL